MVSMCCLCGAAAENLEHLFFQCKFASDLWNWLASCLAIYIDHSSIHSVLEICKLNWSSQVRDIVISGVANIVWLIWYCRNQSRFDSKAISSTSAISRVMANIALTGKLSKWHTYHNTAERTILHKFSVASKLVNVPDIIEVIWKPPSFNWLKCNTDGSSKGTPGAAACRGIFRDRHASILGCFALNLGISFAFHAEIMGAILTIDIAFKKGWHYIWLECDSSLVVAAFSNPSIVPWCLRN